MKPSNVCKHIRTKKMFIPALEDEVFTPSDGKPAHSAHCWCNRTLTEVGPDDRGVAIPLCDPSRSCFEE
jgi:hypothetical protein